MSETMIKQTCFEKLKLKMNTYQIGNNRSKSIMSKNHHDDVVWNFVEFSFSLVFWKSQCFPWARWTYTSHHVGHERWFTRPQYL